MNTLIVAIGSLLLIFVPEGLRAESRPSHYCSKPYKPYQFTDEAQVDPFKADVARYKRCIEDFVDEQQVAIKQHQNAASEAIDDWNTFVKYDLR